MPFSVAVEEQKVVSHHFSGFPVFPKPNLLPIKYKLYLS